MTNFWAVSLFWALLLLFIGVALASVLPPLLRRNARRGQVDGKDVNIAIYSDQLAELKADLDNGELGAAEYEEARREVEKRLSEDVPRESAPAAAGQPGRWPGYVLAGAIPALAIVVYALLGNPEAALAPRTETHAAAEQGQHDAAPMIAALEAKLRQKPDDAAGWYLLARSYGAVGRYGEAVQAFARAGELLPDDSRFLADYADTLAMTQDGNLQGKPLELIEQALKLNAQEQKALNLAGTAAYQAKDFAKAAAYWRRLLKVIPPDDDYAKEIRAAVEEAEKAAGSASGRDVPPRPEGKNGAGEKSGPAPKGTAAVISGTVSVSEEIIGKVGAGDAVFIFAQAPQGPRMPIASLKIDAKQLPYRFVLDDSTAMSPNDSLSNHPEVMVSARVSKSGEAMPRSGDLQGKTGPVKLGRQGLAVVIDTVLP